MMGDVYGLLDSVIIPFLWRSCKFWQTSSQSAGAKRRDLSQKVQGSVNLLPCKVLFKQPKSHSWQENTCFFCIIFSHRRSLASTGTREAQTSKAAGLQQTNTQQNTSESWCLSYSPLRTGFPSSYGIKQQKLQNNTVQKRKRRRENKIPPNLLYNVLTLLLLSSSRHTYLLTFSLVHLCHVSKPIIGQQKRGNSYQDILGNVVTVYNTITSQRNKAQQNDK